VVGDRPAAHRLRQPDRDRDDQRQHGGGHRERQGPGQAGRQQPDDRLVAHVGEPQVAVQHLTQPAQVLQEVGAAQAELVAQQPGLAGRRVRAEHRRRRAAGHQAEQQEQDQGDEHQHGQ
jgi:hypothetical protein